MGSRKFEIALKRTFAFEGGYSDSPFDRGGKTKYGITELTWQQYGGSGDVSEITLEQATEIYWQMYWLRTGLDKLESGGVRGDVLSEIFDCAVNQGVHGAGRKLQAAYNLLKLDENPFLKVDGLVGPITIAAVCGFCGVGRHYCDALLGAIRYKRAGAYESLCVADPVQRKFIRGWFRRLA